MKSNTIQKASLSLLLASSSLFAFASAGSAEEKQPEIAQVKLSNWNESKDTPAKNVRSVMPTNSAEIQLYHNNGNPIETNILERSENPEMNLFAVADYYINNINYKSYYLSDTKVENIQNIQTEALNEINKKSTNLNSPLQAPSNISYAVGSGNATRDYNWSFSTGAKLTSSVQLTRASSNVDINGTTGSVWNVSSTNQLKNTITNPPFVEWTTRLAVPFSAQKLIDYGPDSTSGPTASVGLSGFVPSFNWNFNISGFSITSTSSLSDKYGRWTLNKNLFNPTPTSATMRPGIRTSNTSGNLGVKLSHAYFRSGGTVHATDIITMYVADR